MANKNKSQRRSIHLSSKSELSAWHSTFAKRTLATVRDPR